MSITTNARPRALAPTLLHSVLPTRAGPRFVAFAMARNTVRTLDRTRRRRRPLDTVEPQALAEAAYHPVYPAESFTLDRPAGFSDADWAVFQLRNTDRVPPSFVLDVPGASVVGHEAWIRARSGAFVEGIWSEAGFPLADAVPPHLRGDATPHLRLDGTAACLAMPWLPNYYHWTLQAVPRFHLLSQVVDPASIDHWIVPAQLPAYVREWLDMLGVPADRRVPAVDGTIVCERLIVPSIPAPNRWLPDWAVSFIRERAAPAMGTETGRRLFIARERGEKRRIINQGELDRLLRRADIEPVTMAGRSVHDQIALFASASLVVSVLGAALTNLVYCRPGTKVVEILPKNLTFPAYCKLARAGGLSYHGSIGREPRVPGWFYRTDPSADVIADIPVLADLLGL